MDILTMGFFLLFLGLVLLGLSISWFYKMKTAKEIYHSDSGDGSFDLILKGNQLYAVCVMGGFLYYDKEFSLKIYHQNIMIPLRKMMVNYKFRYRGMRAFEYAYLKTDLEGSYRFEVKDLVLLQGEPGEKKTKLMVRESIAIAQRVGTIVFLISGINALLWGIVLLKFW